MLLACPHCATIYDVKPAVIGENGRSLRCARCQVVWFATRSQELMFAAPAADAAGSVAAPSATASAAVAPAREDVAAAQFASSPAESAHNDVALAPAPDVAFTDAPSLAPAVPNVTPTSSTITLSAEGEDIETFARRRTKERVDRAQRLRTQLGPPAMIAILAVIVSALLAWRVDIVQHAPQLASFYASIGLPVNLRGLVFRDVRTGKETRDGVPILLVEGLIVSTSRAPVEVPRLRFALRDRAGQQIYSWTAMPEQTVLPPGETLPFSSRLASPPSEGHDVVVRFFNKQDTAEGAR